MKIKCAICNKELELNKEEIQKYIVLSRTGKVKPDKLLKILDIFEGPCEEESEHVFSWNLEFLKQVEGLKGKKNELTENIKKDENELSKTKDLIDQLEKQLRNIQEKKVELDIKIENSKLEIPEVEKEFENITGTKDFENWK